MDKMSLHGRMVAFTVGVIAALFQYASCHAVHAACVPPGSPAEELKVMTAVFSGRVIRITQVDRETLGPELLITFTVRSVWKGDPGDIFTVATEDPLLVSDQIHFAMCEDYLVYVTSWPEDRPYVSGCGRTARLADAVADIIDLGQPLVVKAPSEPRECGTLPGILGTWQWDGLGVAAFEFPYVRFRADGICACNRFDPDGTVVVVHFPYRIERTIAVDGELHEKVVLGSGQNAFDRTGDQWLPVASEWGPARAFFVLKPGGALQACSGTRYDPRMDGCQYTKSNHHVYELGQDDIPTSAHPTNWGKMKCRSIVVTGSLR